MCCEFSSVLYCSESASPAQITQQLIIKPTEHKVQYLMISGLNYQFNITLMCTL